MSAVRYYRTEQPDVLAAAAAGHAARRELRQAANTFAESFGGKAILLSTVTNTYFGGVRFDPRRPARFWTQPNEHGVQRPRVRAQKGVTWTDVEKAEQKQLIAVWDQRAPRQEVDDCGLYAAIGTDWGNLLFAGLRYFEHDGALYVATSAELAPHMGEILGSAYHAAQESAAAAKAQVPA